MNLIPATLRRNREGRVTEGPQDGEGDNLWNRLRRRKVVQWGIAYAAGAWGFLQGLAYVSTLLDWPAQLQKITGLALLIGLPIAVTLAWFHGDRGHRRVTRTELAILTGLFLVGGGLFWRYQHAIETATVATPSTSAAAIAPAAAIANDNSIAVLPFVNMSDDKANEYFSDGLSEELLNLLAQVPQLRVIARTSSFSFKDRQADITEIAQKLNVAHVLEGSVRKSGDTLRITAQLIRTADSSHLWSQTYDRPMTDVFKVQDEIAAAVVDQLRIKLLGTIPKAKVTNPKAYTLFLQARDKYRQYTAASIEESIVLYQQALAFDPAYTAAWAGLAEVYSEQAFLGLRPVDAGMRLVRESTAKALALDPQYAPAHTRLGWIAMYFDRDFATAARHLEHALVLEPANRESLGIAYHLTRRLGRLNQAITIAQYLIARDPLDADGHYYLSAAYRVAGKLDEAIAEQRTVINLTPLSIRDHEILGEMLLQKGNASAALVEMQQETDEATRLVGLTMAHQALGQKAESDAALAELIEKYGSDYSFNIAYVFAFRGEADRSFEWLNKAVEYHDLYLSAVAVHPMFANIHSDPRWLPFLRKLGMAPEQLAPIKFDVKLPD
jgi:TolB-like protein